MIETANIFDKIVDELLSKSKDGTVYIMPARGNMKTRLTEAIIKDIVANGGEVVPVYTNKDGKLHIDSCSLIPKMDLKPMPPKEPSLELFHRLYNYEVEIPSYITVQWPKENPDLK